MHSWVFRHRGRLRVIYGLPQPETPEAHPERVAPALPVSPPHARLAPGTLAWRRKYVVIAPMRPPRF